MIKLKFPTPENSPLLYGSVLTILCGLAGGELLSDIIKGDTSDDRLFTKIGKTAAGGVMGIYLLTTGIRRKIIRRKIRKRNKSKKDHRDRT